jgi:hypothetical protein
MTVVRHNHARQLQPPRRVLVLLLCVVAFIAVLGRCPTVTAFRPIGATLFHNCQLPPTPTAPWCRLNGPWQSGARRHECSERTVREARRLLHEIAPISSSPLVCFALSSLDNAQSSAAFSNDNETNHVESPQPMNMETTETSTSPSLAIPGYKLRRLKDMMWVRETLEDLTAAEFACTVETVGADDDDSTGSTTGSARPKRRKRAVDYEKLLTQLNRRIRDMGCESVMENSEAVDVSCVLESDDTGMGSLTYSDAQRTALLQRLFRTRRQLLHVIHGNKIEVAAGSEQLPFAVPLLQIPTLPPLPRMEIPKEEVEDALSPKLYVRDDGTVDWDGALTSAAALRKFGTAVWARINGRESDSVTPTHETMSSTTTTTTTTTNTSGNSHSNASKAVTAKIVETPEIKDARMQLETLSQQLFEMEKDHYKLLNSVISQGQATANIKLALLDSSLRSRIQASAAALETIKVRVSVQTLVYEMERIYTYLVGELGNPALNGYIPLQDRLNVAEFGLLESQVDSFNRQFLDNESVDEDVLAVVFEQLTDFKRRLGIDYYVAGLSFDREAIGRWLGELWGKTKNGLAFYVKGVRLFWNDVVFCLKLINRAAQGYTLKPREVRTIRYVLETTRTGHT